MTALLIAAATGQGSVVKVLCNRGADAGAEDDDGRTLLWLASHRAGDVNPPQENRSSLLHQALPLVEVELRARNIFCSQVVYLVYGRECCYLPGMEQQDLDAFRLIGRR